MLPVVNGKLLFDCEEEDLQVLVDNPDYRENEYLDYKLNFAFLEYSKGDKKREEHLAEFRSDVCSFLDALYPKDWQRQREWNLRIGMYNMCIPSHHLVRCSGKHHKCLHH